MTVEAEFAASMTERLNGPFHLRLLLQPCMALLFALRDGRKDARAGADPFLWSILFRPGLRRGAIASAWESIGKVLIIAFTLDCAFQYATTRSIDLTNAIVVALLLCAVPYSLARGPASRFGRK